MVVVTRRPPGDAGELRAVLRRDLTAALKARQPDTVAALRNAIAAIDNAQAVAVQDDSQQTTSAHIAGARLGAGSAEAARRPLSHDEVHAILGGQIDELTREAGRYQALGQADAARRLDDQAGVLAAYLPPNQASG